MGVFFSLMGSHHGIIAVKIQLLSKFEKSQNTSYNNSINQERKPFKDEND